MHIVTAISFYDFKFLKGIHKKIQLFKKCLLDFYFILHLLFLTNIISN